MSEPLKRPSFTPGARTSRPHAPVEPRDNGPPPHERPEDIAALKAKAVECPAEWADFTSRADLMPSLIEQDHLTADQFEKLGRWVYTTRDRAAERASKAKRAMRFPTGDTSMSDGQVTAAIRLLTGLDADHAAVANDEGWDGRDSSTGHWCAVMLSKDPMAAIALGRTIVGNYKRQLKLAGIAMIPRPRLASVQMVFGDQLLQRSSAAA